MDQNIVMPNNKNDKHKPDKKKNISLWVAIGLIIILLALILWLWWQLMNCINHDATLENDKKQLQTQVDDLKKQAADKGAATADTTTCTATVSQSLKDNIRDAINSDNTAALEGYMASSLKVIIAASEFGETRTPAQAVSDLNYIQSSSGWNFALPTPTINTYLAGSYGTGSPGTNYFAPNTYFGKASDEKVVAFNFDSCGKINQVFMAANADLLLL